MPKLSRWKAQHAGCQQAVDNVKADFEAEVARLRTVLATVVGAFTNGVYCGNCGESVDDCDCVISEARTALGD